MATQLPEAIITAYIEKNLGDRKLTQEEKEKIEEKFMD